MYHQQIFKPMTRAPYAPPATEMERHIEKLVKMLEHGIHNRSEFHAAIEDAMSHAFWLESQMYNLLANAKEFDRRLAVSIPNLVSRVSTFTDITTDDVFINLFIDCMRCRLPLRTAQRTTDPIVWSKIRRVSYLQLLKIVKGLFDGAFPKVPPASDREGNRLAR
jgi:hypothetical protein